MKKYIHIQKEDRKFLAEAFEVTERTIFNATHFEDMNEGTDLMKKIRSLALQRGGIVMVKAPEWEVLHDSDGYIRYYLGDILLEFSKKEPVCDVFKHGEKMRHYDNVMTSDIQSIQDWAARL
jgi:AAA+ ATPase superfamily predicted ATPase